MMAESKKKQEITEKDLINETLSSLSTLLKNREEDLLKREAKLEEERKIFDSERFDTYGATKPSDVIHLNIGGEPMSVLRRTLTSVPGSMLASRFSGRWEDNQEKDENGHYFIDQSYDLFEPMINYLRNRSNGIELYPLNSPYFSDDEKRSDFYRMVEYYGMTDGIYPTSLIIHHGPEDNVEMESRWKVNVKEWTTLLLARNNHSRYIKTFSVLIGPVERIQIGWLYNTTSLDFSTGNKLGVGDVEYTSSIDLTRSCYLCDGANTPIEGLQHQAGTVVRSEDYGRQIFVNDELMVSSSNDLESGVVQALDPEKWSTSSDGNVYQYLHPTISVKGQFEIIDVEFTDL
eukprot:CAMPEP_0178952842 /NCGR_PEP_ID=MMETSP0789-20121207/8080_1 /TAXON_ID=3005 /ORGANISM="Rhizosolenia setigera, Strain CCMP 1694" /LENGTH=345 /DNA_ID=CAMNT_0020634019 /DNA_START=132 /DNA_END=1169 /DNA_ORIENTATION=-